MKRSIQARTFFSLLLFWLAILLSPLLPLPVQAADLPPVRIATEPPAYYEKVQDACNAEPAGALIKTQSKIFGEDLLTIDRNITLQGGFNTDYSAVVGVTYLEGNIIITAGTVTLGDFKVTAEPPIKITSPGPTANVSTPLLNFTSAGQTASVKVDDAAVSKVSGDNLDFLPDGQHTIRIDSTDAAGRAVFATKTFTVDTVAPIVTISSPVSGITNTNRPRLDYLISEGTAIVKVDDLTVSKGTGDLLDILSEGTHTVRVEARDPAGNLGSAAVTFTVDTILPSISIDPINTPISNNTVTISGSVENGAQVSVSVNTSASAGPVSYPTATTWSCSISDLSVGQHVVTASAVDNAQNTAFATLNFAIDLAITNVTASTQAINTFLSESTTIFFTLTGPATSTFKIIPEKLGPTGTPVYQASQIAPGSGSYFFTWDGKDNAGIVVPDEAYLFILDASDSSTGAVASYNPAPPTGSGSVTCSQDDGYDADKNDPLTINYAVSQQARVDLKINASGSIFKIMDSVAHAPGNYTFDWNGRSNDGKILTAESVAQCEALSLLGDNVVVTSGDTPKITLLKTDPYDIQLSYGEFTRITYALSRSANVTISLIPASGSAIAVLSGQPQTSGPQQISWDGISPDGIDPAESSGKELLIIKEGEYTVSVKAANPENPARNSESFGSLRIWR